MAIKKAAAKKKPGRPAKKATEKVVKKRETELTDAFFQGRKSHGEFVREKTGYPHSILEFATDQLGLHPTAKPVALMEYLINTYTLPGETVMDNTMGSGTTGVAAGNTGRKFIGMERDPKYFAMCQERIAQAYAAPKPVSVDDEEVFTAVALSLMRRQRELDARTMGGGAE